MRDADSQMKLFVGTIVFVVGRLPCVGELGGVTMKILVLSVTKGPERANRKNEGVSGQVAVQATDVQSAPNSASHSIDAVVAYGIMHR